MWSWIENLPTTNLRILVSIGLASIYVLAMLVGIILGKTIDLELAGALGVFLLTMMGLDVAQYVQKRKSFQQTDTPTAPTAPEPGPADPATAPAPHVIQTIIERTD